MKIGLVLAGGGGKGAYELGVWKALKQLNLTKYISVFSGTSIEGFLTLYYLLWMKLKKQISFGKK